MNDQLLKGIRNVLLWTFDTELEIRKRRIPIEILVTVHLLLICLFLKTALHNFMKPIILSIQPGMRRVILRPKARRMPGESSIIKCFLDTSSRDCVAMSLRGSEATEAILYIPNIKGIAALPTGVRNDEKGITTQSVPPV